MKPELHIRLDPELLAAVKEMAESDNRTITGMVVHLLKKAVQERVKAI